MFRSILVPLDGSNFGEHALSLALTIARRSSGQLHLVHSVGALLPELSGIPTSVAVFNTAPIERDMRESMEAYLALARQRVLHVAEVPITTEVLYGGAGDAILDYAQHHEVDLIAMATHGRGGLNRKWLGSVAEAVVRKAALPVLLSRSGEDVPAVLDETVTVGRILLPLEDSEFSASILPDALTLASCFGAEVVLMAVVIPGELEAQEVPQGLPEDPDARLLAAMQNAERHLESRAAAIRENGTSVIFSAISAQHAADAILARAEETDAAVIAMATHARRGVARLLFGSVADKVVRGTARAILLRRPS